MQKNYIIFVGVYFAANVNPEFFIAKRVAGTGSGPAAPIVRIAQIGIAAGVCVMLLSLFITAGFKKEITSKLSIFSSHIDLTPASVAGGWSEDGDSLPSVTFAQLAACKDVADISPYVSKPAILHGKDDFHGIIMHGLSPAAAKKFTPYLKKGNLPASGSSSSSSEILISSETASLMQLSAGDRVTAYFVQQQPRTRIFTVSGIYETGFKEYDATIALCDIGRLQQINGWDSLTYSGVAITMSDFGATETFADMTDLITDNVISDSGWITRTIFDKSPEIFDWLSLLDMNVWVILILLVTVSGFNMVSSLIIIILEKARMIGILKSMGMKGVSIRKLFLCIAAVLAGRGMLWGNISAFAIAAVQASFHIIKLDAATYYMSWVPVSVKWSSALLLNAGVIAAVIAMLVIPTAIISKIDPVKVIRFD